MHQAIAFITAKRFLPVCCCLLLVTAYSQENNTSNENASSRWLDGKIIIDGKSNEWDKSDFVKDDKSGINYIISNDSSVFYICLIAKDEITKTKILNAGFSLFLNNEGKKKKSFTIDYPMQNVDNSFANDPGRLKDLKTLQLISFLNAKIYQLSGFKKGDGLYSVGDTNDAGIKISLGVNDSAAIVYEAAIPFSSIFKNQTDLKNENNIAICFSINALSKPSNPSSTSVSPTTNGTLSPGRRFSNNNISNTFPSQSFGQMEKLFESSKTWKIISLAHPL